MSRPIVATVALVVLLSTFAGVVGATSNAPGVAANGSTTASGFADGMTATDDALRSGGTYWSGERLGFDASGIVSNDASEDERTFELWRVTADGQLNRRIRTFTVHENGTYRLETGDLVGRYAVRYGEQIVYVDGGVGYLESRPDGSAVTVDAAAFEFSRQTLAFSWSDPSVYPGEAVTLTVTSNRDGYTAAVSGENLTYRNLTTVFPETVYAENHDARKNESVLLLRLGARTGIDLDTTGFTPGNGSLEFDVVDTATEETADLTVEAPAKESHFVSVERRENVGDVIEANVSCTHCFLVAGGPGQGFLDVVELEDTDGDGHVRLRVNTRYAGMNPGRQGYPSNVKAYTSPADSVSRYSPDSELEALARSLVYSYTKLSDLRSQQGLNPTGRIRPIEPGTVRLTLSSSDFAVDRSAWGNQEPLGDQVVVRDETDVRTVTLEPRELSGVGTLAAAGGSQLPSGLGAIKSTSGPRDSVALGDHLVFRFDVSGVFGYLRTNGASVATVMDDREEGIRMTLLELPEGDGASPIVHRLDQTAAKVYADPATDSLYLAVQTGGTSRTNLQAGRYRARLTLTGVDGKHDGYSTVDAYTGNPYLQPGESESVSGTATVEPPTAAIVAPEAGSSPRMNADGSLVVNGTTSLAPGGDVHLLATATEYAWNTSATPTVNDTGHWTGSLNLTGAPGEEFTVVLEHGNTQFDERTYTVRPPLENESGEGNSTGGGSTADQAESASPAGEPQSGSSGLGGLAVPVGGGVGVLVFVWVAWRLVIRRLLL